jgi:hypothetical protein
VEITAIRDDNWDMTTMTPELQAAVRSAQGQPLQLEDPQTHERYVLVPQDVYDRVKAMLEGDLPGEAEQRYFLREAGKAAGWDDPEMDVYDEMK